MRVSRSLISVLKKKNTAIDTSADYQFERTYGRVANFQIFAADTRRLESRALKLFRFEYTYLYLFKLVGVI